MSAGRNFPFMSQDLIATRGVFSGAAIAVGVMSIAAIPVLAVATLPLGVVALVPGLVSRLSLAGFILGIVGMFLGGAVPVLLMLLWRFFGWGD